MMDKFIVCMTYKHGTQYSVSGLRLLEALKTVRLKSESVDPASQLSKNNLVKSPLSDSQPLNAGNVENLDDEGG